MARPTLLDLCHTTQPPVFGLGDGNRLDLKIGIGLAVAQAADLTVLPPGRFARIAICSLLLLVQATTSLGHDGRL